MINEQAPVAKAPKKNEDYIRLEPFPASAGDTPILTAVAFNYIPDHTEFNKTKQIEETYPAVELFFGTTVEGKAYFVKTWPIKYSLHEKANYPKYIKAMTGKDPVAGSTPKDVMGLAVSAIIETQDKKRKDGTPYRVTKLTSFSPVHPQLRNLIVPLAVLRPELEKALTAKKDEGQGNPF